MSEHTPGRLEVLDDRRISVTLPPLVEDCGYMSHCVAITYGDDVRVNSHANARRLVAAWNSCEGISTERLEDLGRPLMAHLIGCDERAHRQVKEADSLRAVNAELLDALEKLLKRDERNTCQHDETHRGGAIWEICDQCGDSWLDDISGKPKWKEPAEWSSARAAIASARKQGAQG